MWRPCCATVKMLLRRAFAEHTAPLFFFLK